MQEKEKRNNKSSKRTDCAMAEVNELVVPGSGCPVLVKSSHPDIRSGGRADGEAFTATLGNGRNILLPIVISA